MEAVADAVVEKVNAKLAKLTVGPPEDNCDITPVVTESSANFIEGLVIDAKEKGATFCQEYKREGNLIWPLLLDHVRPDMRIAWEEPFGPVLPVIRINSVEEGIHHCNASNFGLQVSFSLHIVLSATLGSRNSETITRYWMLTYSFVRIPFQGCVFTKDINKAIMISDAMETGTVQINSAPARGPDHFPFQVLLPNRRGLIFVSSFYQLLYDVEYMYGLQGLKDSGIGSQGITNSINMMTKVKSTVINLPSPSYTMG